MLGLMTLTGAVLCVQSVSPDEEHLRTVHMNIVLTLDAESCAPGENIVFDMRIENPNPFDIALGYFTFGDEQPEIHVRTLLETAKAMPRDPDCSTGNPEVVIPANGSMSRKRFAFVSFSPFYCPWREEPGTYVLGPRMGVGFAHAGETKLRIEWNSNEVRLRVRTPTAREDSAIAMLHEGYQSCTEGRSRQRWPFLVDCFADVYGQFLQDYNDTPYAPQVHFAYVRVALDAVGNRQISSEFLPKVVDQLAKSMTYCLDAAGVYAEPLLQWDLSIGGSHALGFANRHKQFTLAERLAEELDRKYPEDAHARLYRRMSIAGAKGDEGEARRVAEELLATGDANYYTDRARWRLKGFDALTVEQAREQERTNRQLPDRP